jgi:hypothetical protein
MLCNFCQAENLETAEQCHLCDHPLEKDSQEASKHLLLEPVDISRPSFVWKRISIVLSLLLLALLPWLMMSDLFKTPPELTYSQKLYSEANARYFSDKSSWDERKEQLLLAMRRHKGNFDISKGEALFQDLPFELFLSYMDEELHLYKGIFKELTIAPLPGTTPPRLLVARREKVLGLISITTFLTLELGHNEEGRFAPQVVSLQRGTRKIPTGLANIYFSQEFQAFRHLEMFSGGVRDMNLYQKEGDQSLYFSYLYHHRPLHNVF